MQQTYIHTRFNNIILKSISPHNNTSFGTSHTIHHTHILLRFLLTLFHAYRKQYSTHLMSASTSMLGLLLTPPIKPHTPQGNNTQVLEPYTLDLPLTPPIKPHTRRATIRKC
jgi:hypothetical protein